MRGVAREGQERKAEEESGVLIESRGRGGEMDVQGGEEVKRKGKGREDNVKERRRGVGGKKKESSANSQ